MNNLEKFKNSILENVFEPISVKHLASINNMSISTFKRKFQHEFGDSPITWLRNLRLQAAYFYLKSNNKSIS